MVYMEQSGRAADIDNVEGISVSSISIIIEGRGRKYAERGRT